MKTKDDFKSETIDQALRRLNKIRFKLLGEGIPPAVIASIEEDIMSIHYALNLISSWIV